MDGELVYIENFDNDIECRWSFPLENTLLCSTPPSLFITECNGLDAADQVTERRIEHQVFQRVAVRRANQLDTALSDSTRCKGFLLGTNFIDDHNLRHVVFNSFYHHGMLKLRSLYLHPAGASDSGMRHVAITGDFVGCIHDDHAASKLIGDDTCSLPKLGGFTNAWATKEEDGLSAFDDVPDDVDGSVDASPNAACQANNFILAVSNGRDAMKGTFNPCSVVRAKVTDLFHNGSDVSGGDFGIREWFPNLVWKTNFDFTSKIEDDFDDACSLWMALNRSCDIGR